MDNKDIYKIITLWSIILCVVHFVLLRKSKDVVSENEIEIRIKNIYINSTIDRADDIFEGRQHERRMRIKNYCKKNEQEKKLQFGVARHLMIDKKNGITWCPICKAGSTAWMKIFATSRGILPAKIKRRDSNIEINKIARRAFPYLGYSKTLELINTTVKFMTVRHPFERLLSAYRDKLEDIDKSYYHKKYGKHIVKWYREETNDTRAPSFEEFLQYVVFEKLFDEHWSPYYVQCAPCFVRYDYIIKMETFNSDRKHLLERLFKDGSDSDDWDNANADGRTDTMTVKKRYYSDIPLSLLKRVYEIYERDFIMFGYSTDEYYAMAKRG